MSQKLTYRFKQRNYSAIGAEEKLKVFMQRIFLIISMFFSFYVSLNHAMPDNLHLPQVDLQNPLIKEKDDFHWLNSNNQEINILLERFNHQTQETAQQQLENRNQKKEIHASESLFDKKDYCLIRLAELSVILGWLLPKL